MTRFRTFFGLGKRVLFLTLALMLVAVGVGTGFALYSSSLIGPAGGADLVSYTVSAEPVSTALTGVGISLGAIPSANLVSDPSFEPYVFRTALRVFSGDALSVTVSSEEASAGLYGEGFFKGAAVRILSATEDGFVLRKSGTVAAFGINRIGPFSESRLPQDLPKNAVVTDFGVFGDLVGATTQKGVFLLGIGTQSPALVETGLAGDLTGVCGTADGFLIVSAKGEAAVSPDGQAWTAVPVEDPAPLRAVASASAVHVAVGDKGVLRLGVQGAFYAVVSGTDADLLDVAADAGRFVVVGEKGTVLVSGDGYLWKAATTDALDAKAAVRAVAARDGRFVAVGDNGLVLVSDDGATFRTALLDGAPDLVDVAMLNRSELVALDAKSGFWNSLDGGATWAASAIDTGMDCRVFDTDGKDLVLSAGPAGVVGTTRLVARIQLDAPLAEGTFTAGDLCLLELSSAMPPAGYLGAGSDTVDATGPWILHGHATAERIAGEGAPGSGSGFLRLTADAEADPGSTVDGAWISQRLVAEGGYSRLPKQVLCRVELWMRQTGTGSKTAKVWVSGPFPSIGATFERIGARWKKYSFTFLAPASADGITAGEVRLNVGFTGLGHLDVDGVYLGTAADDAAVADPSFIGTLQDAAPALLRLGALGIGSRRVEADAWAGLDGTGALTLDGAMPVQRSDTSLEAGLRLAGRVGASPWLVIDAYASEAELRNLLEYIAGPINEVYGQKRLGNGTAAPWTGTFDRFVLEFADEDGILGSDGERARFVNTMIDAVEGSPYYKYLKAKVLFVDGMDYDDGVMLSRADLHASSLQGGLGTPRADSLDAILDGYYESAPRLPDRPATLPLETLRTLRLTNAGSMPQAADYAEAALRDLGGLTGAALVGLPDFNPKIPASLESRVAAILSRSAAGVPLAVTRNSLPLPTSAATAKGTAATTAADLGRHVGAYAFRDDNAFAAVLDNRADRPVILDLTLPYALKEGRVYRYNADGVLVDSAPANGTRIRVSSLPGWVYVIRGTAPAAK